jgi:hypothetical protein
MTRVLTAAVLLGRCHSECMQPRQVHGLSAFQLCYFAPCPDFGGLSAGTNSVAGAAALSKSSDGRAGVPPSTIMVSQSGTKQQIMWGNRTPLRKDASW